MAWELGQAADAEDNFSYATTDGSGNIYAWLWLSLSQARQGKDASRRSLPEFDRKKWPAPIVSLYLGEADQDAVFAAASTGSPEAIQGQVCEANFYLGEWRLQHNDRAGAKPLIDKAARDCPTGFVEWSPAQMELANLP
jgi:lipoprotein NlpI